MTLFCICISCPSIQANPLPNTVGDLIRPVASLPCQTGRADGQPDLEKTRRAPAGSGWPVLPFRTGLQAGGAALRWPRRFPVAPKKHETDSVSYKIGHHDKYPQRATPTIKTLPSAALDPPYKVKRTEADCRDSSIELPAFAFRASCRRRPNAAPENPSFPRRRPGL